MADATKTCRTGLLVLGPQKGTYKGLKPAAAKAPRAVGSFLAFGVKMGFVGRVANVTVLA
jgi:hypothetical protein